MISSGTIPSKVTYTRDLVAVQTFAYLIESPSTSGDFNVTKGYGITSGSTSVGFLLLDSAGGDVTVTTTGTTDEATYRMGPIARVTNQVSGAQAYYMANVHSGNAKLQKYVAGALTDVATATAFAPGIGELVTITLTCQGADISATFQCASVNGGVAVPLSGSESASIPRAGLVGWKTTSLPGWCASISYSQL